MGEQVKGCYKHLPFSSSFDIQGQVASTNTWQKLQTTQVCNPEENNRLETFCVEKNWGVEEYGVRAVTARDWLVLELVTAKMGEVAYWGGCGYSNITEALGHFSE